MSTSQSPYAPPAAREDDSLFAVVWRQRKTVGGSVLLCLVLGLAYYLLATPVYLISSEIIVEKLNPLEKDQRVDSQETENFLNTQIQIIKSNNVLRLASGSDKLENLKIWEGTRRPVDWLKRELNVEVGKKSSVITVSLEAAKPYRDEAVDVVSAVVEAYKSSQKQLKKERTEEVLEILKQNRADTEARLIEKREELFKFQQQYNTLSLEGGDKSNLTMQRLQSLSDALTAAQLDSINLKTSFESAARSLGLLPEDVREESTGGVVLSAQDEELLRAELFSLRQKRQELARTYLSDHPQLRQLDSRINQLNLAWVISSKARWQASERRQTELQKSFEEQQKAAMQMNAAAGQYAAIRQELDRLQAEVKRTNDNISDATAKLEAGALNIQVSEDSNYEDKPVWPRGSRVLVIALLAGLAIGCGLGVAREWSAPKLRSAADVRSSLGVPVFGAIPRKPGVQSPEALGWAVHLDPSSEVAEGFRAVRTSLQFGVPEGEARTILVTSPTPQDGRSTVVSNLAIALAKAGKRVLVVDADFRNPSQHRIFGVSDEKGFSTMLLRGEVDERAIRRTTVDKLFVLPAGPLPRNPSELLNSAALDEVLIKLAKDFDHVIVDSPAVAKVNDARIVSASCDATLLVLKAEQAGRKDVEDARDGLASVGARLVGAVLNEVPMGTGFTSGFGGLPTLLSSGSRTGSQPSDLHDEDRHRLAGGQPM
jgi:capsular exopolysaccharide synthesis family protein